MLEAMRVAHDAIKVQCQLQMDLCQAVGKTQKRTYNHEKKDENLKTELWKLLYDKAYAHARLQTANKKVRSEGFSKVIDDYLISLPEDSAIDRGLAKHYYHDIQKKAARDLVLNEGVRLDGRKTNEIREIWSEVDCLPSPHGSALFTRGETQSLTTVTLGTKLDQQMIDGAMISGSNKFILHYNFPGFSTGEVKPNRGPGRREVGHGNLALRALKQVLPPDADNPYTIRVVSDILESNGSSSMATVCAGSLALMDAGLPVKGPVSGIAMGMISDSKTGKYAILSDILGDEDHLGDMDFKVTGTRDGITGVQMDIKVDGLSMDVMRAALAQARQGRLHILDAMYETMPAFRPEPKPHAPRMEKLIIDREFIGAVIGPGGKVIQEIQRETGTTINIEEVGQTGEVSIFSAQKENLDKAMAWVKGIVSVPEVGEVYESTVKSVMPYGAFVEFMPGKQGLLHISEVSWKRLETMDGVLAEGDKVKVKLVGTDPKTGKFKLSRKILMDKPEGYVERPERDERGDRGDRGGDRRGGGDRGGDRPRGGDRGGDRPRSGGFERGGGDRGGYNRPPQTEGPIEGPVFDEQ